MAVNQQFKVIAESNLARDIYDHIPNGRTIKLADHNFPGQSIANVSSYVFATEPDQKGHGGLYLTTGMEMADMPGETRAIGDKFVSMIGSMATIYLEKRPDKIERLGIVTFSDRRINDALTSISPSAGAKVWMVNSLLERFRFGGDQDEKAVEMLLGQHALAVTTLALAISTEYDTTQPATETHRLILSANLNPLTTNQETEKQRRTDSFDEFIGIDSVIRDLRNVVKLANLPPETLARNDVELIQAILLYGPSGVGKTALIRALGKELGATIQELNFSEVGSKYISEWAVNVNQIFETAYETSGRVLVVLDEMDGLVVSGNEASTANITAVLKKQLEKVKLYPNVFIAAATNNIELIDTGVLADKRFGLKLPIRLPTQEHRTNIFKSLLGAGEHMDLSVDALTVLNALEVEDIVAAVEASSTKLDFIALAKLTENFSGGDIRELVAQVKRNILLASPDIDSLRAPTQEELFEAIDHARKSRPQGSSD